MHPNIRLCFLLSSRVSQPFLIQDFNPTFFFDMNEVPCTVITWPYCRKSLHRTEKHAFMHDLAAAMILLCTQNEVVAKTVRELKPFDYRFFVFVCDTFDVSSQGIHASQVFLDTNIHLFFVGICNIERLVLIDPSSPRLHHFRIVI